MKPLPTERGSSSVSSASRPMTMPGGPTQYRISRHDDSAAAPYSTCTPASDQCGTSTQLRGGVASGTPVCSAECGSQVVGTEVLIIVPDHCG